MRKLVLSSLTCACLTLVAAAPALASQQCTSHEKMIELLSKRFSEVPKAIGLVGKKRVMEVFVSKNGTWDNSGYKLRWTNLYPGSGKQLGRCSRQIRHTGSRRLTAAVGSDTIRLEAPRTSD